MKTSFEIGVVLHPSFVKFISKKEYAFYEIRDFGKEKKSFDIIESLIKMGILKEESVSCEGSFDSYVSFTQIGMKIKNLIEEEKNKKS